ncbi:Skp1 Cullin-F-box ubiquitin protein ligase subunit [Scheffersomyces coipomensis]|uniref:Skp1 Cullin-F-box ubiquitin protein ligase subunit n=1 Tax=Scheffersomyces coipomensis TaxID=1788519 RepID=UPI00315D68D9
MADEADRMDIDSEADALTTQQQNQIVDGGATTKGPKAKFEVKKWTAVAFWSWDIQIENCAICRNHLMEPCIECQPNAPGSNQEACIAAWGACNHAFHMHCIRRWLLTRNACPLDNTPWEYQKLGT